MTNNFYLPALSQQPFHCQNIPSYSALFVIEVHCEVGVLCCVEQFHFDNQTVMDRKIIIISNTDYILLENVYVAFCMKHISINVVNWAEIHFILMKHIFLIQLFL